MILGEDFQFRDEMKHDTVPIELLTGPYKDVILRYTKVSIKEQENESAKLMFEYEIYKTGVYSEATLRNDKKFQTHIGLILNRLILDSLDEGKNEPRADNTQELIEE